MILMVLVPGIVTSSVTVPVCTIIFAVATAYFSQVEYKYVFDLGGSFLDTFLFIAVEGHSCPSNTDNVPLLSSAVHSHSPPCSFDLS